MKGRWSWPWIAPHRVRQHHHSASRAYFKRKSPKRWISRHNTGTQSEATAAQVYFKREARTRCVTPHRYNPQRCQHLLHPPPTNTLMVSGPFRTLSLAHCEFGRSQKTISVLCHRTNTKPSPSYRLSWLRSSSP